MPEIFAISRDPEQGIQDLLDTRIPNERQASATRKLISNSALTRRDTNGRKIRGAGEYLNFRAHTLCAEDHVEAMKTVRMLEKRAENWGFAVQLMKLTPVTIISLLSLVHYVGGVRVPFVIDGIGNAQWGVIIGTLIGLNPLPLMAGVLHTMVTGGQWFGMRGFITRGGLAFAGSAALMFLLNSQAKRNLEEAWDRRTEIQDGMETIYRHIRRDYLEARLSTILTNANEEQLDELAEIARHLNEKKAEIAQIYGANVDAYEEHIAAPCRRIEMLVQAIRSEKVDFALIQEAVDDFNARSRPGAGVEVTAPITQEQRCRCIRSEIERLEILRATAIENQQDSTVATLSNKLRDLKKAAEEAQRLARQRQDEWAEAGDDQAKRGAVQEKYGHEESIRDAYVVAYYASRADAAYTTVLEEYRTGLRGFTYVSPEGNGTPPPNRPELIDWVKQKMWPVGEQPVEELITTYDAYLWITGAERPVAVRRLGCLPSERSDGTSEERSAEEDASEEEPLRA